MIIEIKPLGKLFQVDENGYLESNLSLENIQAEWKPAVDDFAKIVARFAGNIKSVYLRGSVASGASIKSVSDIDFLIVTNQPISKKERQQINEASNKLNYDFITRFDIDYFVVDEILNIRERTLIKIMAICVYGEDISKIILPLKPGIDTAISLGSLSREIKDTIDKIGAGYYSDSNTRDMCVWLMKRLVRSGFELVSERVKSFTRDLYICWKVFSQFYPEKKGKMYYVLYLAINPTDDPLEVREIIEAIGYWLIDEAVRGKLIEFE